MTANVKKKIRVMVVDDHFVVRMGLNGSINVEADMVVGLEASTGEQALAMYRQHQPDIVLMDLKLAGDERRRSDQGDLPGISRRIGHHALDP